jgi:aryl-alcohol dehydrogenase-like predicted oxidoreductase
MRMTPLVDPASGEIRMLSRLALGCSQVGSFGNRATPAQSRALIAAALDLGVNVLDTADIYGQGDSEREIGRVVRSRRDQAFVVTKFGKTFSAKMRMALPLKPILKPLLALRGGGAAVTAQRGGAMREDFTASRLRTAIEASLRRLGMDHVDAVLLHGPSVAVYADPAVRELLSSLKKEGKARHFGASCDQWEEIAPALTLPDLTLLQLPYDLIERLAGDPAGKAIADRGVAIMAREVIRLQPALPPVAAFAAAAARPEVATVVAGTGRLDHLTELAAACG